LAERTQIGFSLERKGLGTICRKAVGVTRGMRKASRRSRRRGVCSVSKLDDPRLDDLATGAAGSILFSPGHAPLMASALSVGDLSVRMRNDGHEPNRAEKQ
jgi:hypothetical protein